jgi:hypothetical protein
MTAVWNKIQQLAEQIELKFKQSGEQYSSTEHNYNWYNSLYTSPRYRRAHVEIVDNRQTHKIYILHSTVFAHFNDPSPIWGFDAVCGPNKITGAFHDFSAAGDPEHSMIKWFAAESAQLEWNKPRELPAWARQIFTPHMIAAGNVNDGAELDALCDMALRSLDYYLTNVGNTQTAGADYHMAQNRYCYYQKQNPHVIKSMVTMGVEETTMHQFVNEILFPEVA